MTIPMTDEYRTEARAVSNAWRTEWESGCDYQMTGEEPEWDTTQIARALHFALNEIAIHRAFAVAVGAKLVELEEMRHMISQTTSAGLAKSAAHCADAAELRALLAEHGLPVPPPAELTAGSAP